MQPAKDQDNAILIGLCPPGERIEDREDSIRELARLAETARIRPLARRIQKSDRIRYDTYVGRGFIERCLEEQKEQGQEIQILLFDHELSGSQARNIEKQFQVDVMDRTEVILKIFQDHAQTKEARLQVRLAELKYQMPRLKRLWIHLDREGGSSKAGAALRGMGEKQIEKDRRRLQREIFEIEKTLDKMVARIELQRKSREKHCTNVSIVGYTNTGKSTLFNRLTGSGVLVADKLFATLDATSRSLRLKKGTSLVLSDTVGFIADLPHHLVASFRATLKEAQEADLLLHVVDISDTHYEKHMADVQKVLRDIQAGDIPQLLVFNKMDKVSGEDLRSMQRAYPDAFFVSAKHGTHLDSLVRGMEKILNRDHEYHLLIPLTDPKAIGQAHDRGTVLEKHYGTGQVWMRVQMREQDLGELDAYLAHERTPGFRTENPKQESRNTKQ